ncbi:sensor histidine kinase [Candidatus Stoquefichus massiliensis]|uniref:sensor histidine kinase n=1 Tax=Candidatus Stoquefichus massiliensis TaxID=1470350 RepID=UPI0004854C83|nr:HAMP domain-containing sensor histidine kinase [Candidatus Stoquefichus massiliensis]
MIYLVVILILAIIGLIIYIARIHREIYNISKQLEIKQEGSHIQLMAQVHTKPFDTLYHQLEIMLDEYQQKQMTFMYAEEQLKMTIQNMAHDLRTPLTSSMGYMHMLKECHDDAKKQRYLDISIERMEELKRLLEELFLYTKLISKSYVLECEKITIYPILTKILFSFYHLFEKNNQEPTLQFQDESMECIINQEAIERILRNLINNALLHGIGDLIIIQDHDKLIFKNTIKKGEQPDIDHIFDRFYKADQSRSHSSSGLGLAIVKELMEKMGGAVKADIEENSFIIILIFNNKSLNKNG